MVLHFLFVHFDIKKDERLFSIDEQKQFFATREIEQAGEIFC
jgi:hypothetical protein